MASKRREPGPPSQAIADPAESRQSPPPDDEWAKLSQREKFIRTAREVGADETGEALDEALRAVGRARKQR